MNQFLYICLALLIWGFNAKDVPAVTKIDQLPECVITTHCVLESWETSDVERTFTKAVEAVANTPRTKIVEQTNSYIHAEAKTKWRRYTDDLLIKAIPEKNLVQVRSESRVGTGDNGVNKKRVKELAYRLSTNQTN